MSYITFGWPKSIEDLIGKSAQIKNIPSFRPRVNILVIDDNSFAQKENLKNQNLKIDQVEDLQSWEAAAAYPLIFCDINGVGKQLGGLDGGFLIKELKKHYPQKYVIAYSGQTFDPTHNRYFNQADYIMKKDSDLEEWIDRIDGIVTAMIDPVKQWKRARNALIENNIRLELLLLLENDFVTKIEKNDDLREWQETKVIKKLEPIAKSIIGDLVTSLLVGKITS